MEAYVITLISASFAATLIGILSPRGEGGGIFAHVKLLTSLFLICVLISPLKSVIQGISDFATGDWESLWGESDAENDYRDQMNDAMQEASVEYFTQMLTKTLESQFDMESGTVRCFVEWEMREQELRPVQVRVILSGGSIWKDPHAIEAFVSELLGCSCVTAIE